MGCETKFWPNLEKIESSACIRRCFAEAILMSMDITKLSSSNFRAVFNLLTKREKLEKELEQINAKIAAAFAAPSAAPAKKSPAAKSAKPAKPVKSGRNRKRGSLKNDILAVLTEAGPEGLSSPEIAAKVNVPNQHVHVWYSGTGKKVAGLVKTADKRLVYTPQQEQESAPQDHGHFQG